MDAPLNLNANGLTDDEQQVFDNLYGTEPTAAQPPKPGFFTGITHAAGAIPHGLAFGGLDVAQTIVNAPNDLVRPYETDLEAQSGITLKPLNPPATHYYAQLADNPTQQVFDAGAFGEEQDLVASADQWIADARSTADEMYRPDPQTTGAAGNTIYGALEPLTRIAAGAALTGGEGDILPLAGAASSMGYERTQELESQGVDAQTAQASGLTTAGTFMAMGAVGGEGSTLMRFLKSGAANLGAGIANRGLDHEILAANGYDKLAQQEKWNDLQAMFSDALVGIAFPALHMAGAKLIDASATRSENRLAEDILAGRKPAQWQSGVPSELVGSALTSLNAKHAADMAPGIPTDPRSQGLHYKALDAAIKQVLNGDDVDVEPLTRGMQTVPRPAPQGLNEALRAHGIEPDMDAPNFGMPEPTRTLPEDSPLLVPRDTDMSPEREVMRQALVDERFTGKEPVPPGEQPIAIVMGGGGASGKGTVLKAMRAQGLIPGNAVELDPDSFKTGSKDGALHGIPEYSQIVAAGDSRAAAVTHEESSLLFDRALERGISQRNNLVLDRTLSNGDKGEALLQKLKGAGYRVHLIGVSVHPGEAVRRAVKRAMGPQKRHVPLSELLKAHKGFSQSLPRYVPMADLVTLLDNNVEQGADPVEMAHAQGGAPLEITDTERYNDFAEKAKLNEQATTHRELTQHAAAGVGETAQLGRQVHAAGVGGGDRGTGEGRATAAEPVPDATALNERQAGRVSDRVYHGTLGTRPSDRGTAEADGGRGEEHNARGSGPAVPGLVRQPPANGAVRSETGSHLRPEDQANLNPAAGGVSASGPGEPLHPWTPVNDDVSIPYAGGVSADGRTIYLDKRMPDTVEVDGKTIDAKQAVALHERTEWPLMHLDGPMDEAAIGALLERVGDEGEVPTRVLDKLRAGESLTYSEAHQIAALTENHFVRETYGVDPEKYQAALKEGIAAARKAAPSEGDIPADLDGKPYADSGEQPLLSARATIESHAADTAPGAGTGEPQRGAGAAQPGTAADHPKSRDGVGLDKGAASEVARARQALAQQPDVTLADGTSARDAMQAADAEVNDAQKQADGIEAALQCFLSFGGEV